MSLKCGIVGLPNVGKSTLFNALTKAGIAAENYPFCTIEPNVGIVEAARPAPGGAGRDRQARAGGAGDRRVRRHRRPGGRRVQGRRPGQPVPRAHPRDRRHRQRRALLRRRERRSTSPARSTRSPTSRSSRPSCAWPTWPPSRRRWRATPRSPRPAATRRRSAWWTCSSKCQAALDAGQPGARASTSARRSSVVLKPLCLITAKPAMFVGNVAEDGFENNPYLDRLREYADEQNAPVVAICAKIEAELADMDDEDQHAVPGRDGPGRAGPEPPDPRRLQAARPADLLHRRREGSARLDDPRRRHRAAGRRRDPHRLRARLHPRPDHRLRRLHRVRAASRARRTPARCAPKARSTSSRTAT